MSVILSLRHILKFGAICDIWQYNNILRREIISPAASPKDGGPPLIGSLRMFTRCIRRSPPYLETAFSIRNLRTRPAVVTREPLDIVTPDKALTKCD
jgi:hypothetical protein